MLSYFASIQVTVRTELVEVPASFGAGAPFDKLRTIGNTSSARTGIWCRQIMMLIALAGTSTFVAAVPQETCPYLPEYRGLRATLPRMSPQGVAAAIERYASTHENPDGCEAADIDRRLAALEKSQFQLRFDRARWSAHAVFRCNEFDPKSGRCVGPMEDGTAQVGGTSNAQPLRPRGKAIVATSHQTARLVGLYVTTLANALDGRAPISLPMSEALELPAGSRGSQVLIAVYTTEGAWRYRKAVWYF